MTPAFAEEVDAAAVKTAAARPRRAALLPCWPFSESKAALGCCCCWALIASSFEGGEIMDADIEAAFALSSDEAAPDMA